MERIKKSKETGSSERRVVMLYEMVRGGDPDRMTSERSTEGNE